MTIIKAISQKNHPVVIGSKTPSLMKTVTFLESFPAPVLKSEIDVNFVVSQIGLVYNRDLSLRH
jgi:hypothetical protein